MRVAVVINSRAGSVNAGLVEAKIRQALFRCDLTFVVPQTIGEMDAFAAREIGRADSFMICGGDGTINVTLQSLMRQSKDGKLPPLCLVRSGTANDLALEIGVSHKIEVAARAILEGTVKHIDLIELTSETGRRALMTTNGGLGIPAITADAVNRVRSTLRRLSVCPKTAKGFRYLAHQSYGLVKKMGPGIYTMMALEAIRGWDGEDWELEVEVPDRQTMVTKASCVLVNNQPTMGRSLTTAPFTSNSDGLVNLLVTEASTIGSQINTLLSFRRGTTDRLPSSRSFEVSWFRIKSRDGARPLTFFGDGEILLRDVREITGRCLHRQLPVLVR